MNPNPSGPRKKVGIKKKIAFGILKGGGLTQELEKSRRKERQREDQRRIKKI